MLVSVLSYAQDCKFAKDEKDAFTGKHKIMTPRFRVSKGLWNTAMFTFGKNDDQGLLYIYYAPVGSSAICSEGNKFLILLEEGNIIELKNNKTVVSQTTYVSGSASADIEPSFFLSNNDLVKLIKFKATKLRLYMNDGYKDIDVSDAGASKIHDYAKCIYNK